MIFYNACKWKKVQDGYELYEGASSVKFISELLMKRYLINGQAREIEERKIYKSCTQLALSL
jgi:hypothetical protein